MEPAGARSSATLPLPAMALSRPTWKAGGRQAGSATRRKSYSGNHWFADFLIRAVGFNRLQRGVQFSSSAFVIRTHGNAEAGAEVLRVGHFRRGDARLRVGFQPIC